ncbi:MAG: hypothetical protein EOO28_15935 [Comamonadaceae bacterium]|nr:MAG: hypothetical protein EOO28_15935 [Comamonadaceae bacterium]
MISKKNIVLTTLMASLLAACGGGDDAPAAGGGSSTTVDTSAYTYFSLADAPFTARSIDLKKASTTAVVTGSATLASDTASYSIATDGSLTVSSPFTVVGTLSTTGLQVCKPAGTAAGANNTAQVFAKSVYIILPADAVPGTFEDLKGKTFDFYEDCVKDGSLTVNAAGVGTSGSGDTVPAALLASVFTASGTTDVEEGATVYGKIYKTATKVYFVERGVPTVPGTANNGNGYIAVNVSR